MKKNNLDYAQELIIDALTKCDIVTPEMVLQVVQIMKEAAELDKVESVIETKLEFLKYAQN